MRLVGATPRQISVISTVEATVAAMVGVAVGFVLFFLFRPLLVHVPFTGAPFAPGDLSLNWVDVVLVVIGVPVAAVVSARLALRRVQVSPLGVQRRVTSSPPRVGRIIPLLAGIALLAYFDAAGKPGGNGSQVLELLVGFVLLIVGLVLAGPWFTTAGSRLMAKRANRPATLIAGRRLLDNPKAAFRFISGLVIALFIASAAIGALSSITAVGRSSGGQCRAQHPRRPVLQLLDVELSRSAQVPSVPGPVLAELRTTPGVRAVTVVHQNPSQAPFDEDRSALSRATSWRRPRRSASAHRERRWRASATSFRTFSGTTRTRRRRSGRPRAFRWRTLRAFPSTRSWSPPTGRQVPSNGRGRCSNEPFRSRERPSRSSAVDPVDGAPSHDDPRHDRRGHRGQPDHRRLQPRREHRRRTG